MVALEQSQDRALFLFNQKEGVCFCTDHERAKNCLGVFVRRHLEDDHSTDARTVVSSYRFRGPCKGVGRKSRVLTPRFLIGLERSYALLQKVVVDEALGRDVR